LGDTSVKYGAPAAKNVLYNLLKMAVPEAPSASYISDLSDVSEVKFSFIAVCCPWANGIETEQSKKQLIVMKRSSFRLVT
jgi:hypothetical protein